MFEYLNLQAQLLEWDALDLRELIAVQQTCPQAVIQVIAFTWRHPKHTDTHTDTVKTEVWLDQSFRLSPALAYIYYRLLSHILACTRSCI